MASFSETKFFNFDKCSLSGFLNDYAFGVMSKDFYLASSANIFFYVIS